MTSRDIHASEQMLDLMIDRVASGTGDDNALGVSLNDDLLALESAAGALAFAFASADADPIPAGLRDRCAGAARAILDTSPPAVEQARPSPPLRFTPPTVVQQSRSPLTSLGWLAAAACLAIAAFAWWPASPDASAAPAERMGRLVANATDLTRWDWQPWGEGEAGVSGEVVWSEAAQEGYMVLEGLPENDPSQEQYQLWVVESSRGTPLEVPPVDGGVFNVDSSGRTVIPVRCTIPAEGVVAFAITREPPGGVVVSDQSRKVVIAAPSAG